jgi:hypothetical protein
MKTGQGAIATVGLTALHTLLFLGFFSQLILVDSRGCDVSCGNLAVDLFLLCVTPVSWIVALAASIAVFIEVPQLRRVCVGCWAGLLIPVIVVVGSFIAVRLPA